MSRVAAVVPVHSEMQLRQKARQALHVPASPPSPVVVAILEHHRPLHHSVQFGLAGNRDVASALSLPLLCPYTYSSACWAVPIRHSLDVQMRVASPGNATVWMGTGRQGAKIALSVCRAKWLAEMRP